MRRYRRRIRTNFGFESYRPKQRFEGHIWSFHSQDDDYWPSISHGHSIDSKVPLKLDTYTGEIYDCNSKEIVGRVKPKDFKQLIINKKFIEMDEKANRYYSQKYPELYKRLGYPKLRSVGNHRLRKVLSGKQINNTESVFITALSIEFIEQANMV